MARAFNIREGISAAEDRLPTRFFTSHPSGPLQGVAMDRERLAQARQVYYEMMGWDREGVPLPSRLAELDVPWVAEALKKT